MSRTIGIDLGTYNSAGAVALGRDQVMVESRYGKSLYGKNFPSFVLFDHTGQKQAVGKKAKAELAINPKLVIWGVKRLVGLTYEGAEANDELGRFQYDIERDPGWGGGILIKVGEERYTPHHILQFILQEIKEDAENGLVNRALGERIERAVISVPACFAAARTGHIIEAAKGAGFADVDTIAEPTAAAIRYGLQVDKEANLLAFDIGAGTLDVTIMMLGRVGEELIPGERAPSGDERLGGIDMDDMLASYVIERYGLEGVREDSSSMAMLTQEVEKTKIGLSTKETRPLDLPNQQTVDLTRGELEEVIKPLLERCRGPIRVALQQARLSAGVLDHVLLIGGPVHMPCVRRLVRDELAKLGAKPELLAELEAMEKQFEIPRGKRQLPIDPMECVAQGASLKAEKIIEHTMKRIREGYGTSCGDYYNPIIKENSNYPISGRGGQVYGNPNLLEVPVSLVMRWADDTDKSTSSGFIYTYKSLREYPLSITPTGNLPEVDIRLEVTDNGRLVVTLVQTHGDEQAQGGQRLRLEGVELLVGEETQLQEDRRPEWKQEDIKRFTEAFDRATGGWTRAHLERLIHAAQEVLTLVKDPTNAKVKRAREGLESAVRKAVDGDYGNPNDDCPTISNRAKELLNILSLPEIAQIGAEDFLNYVNQLKEIGTQLRREG